MVEQQALKNNQQSASFLLECRSAFVLFKEDGIKAVENHFPNCVAFVKENSTFTIEEVTKELTTQLDKIHFQSSNYGNDIIDKYLKMTGQTFQDLMSGVHAYGMNEVVNIAARAIKEKKKIVWKDDFELIDSMSYTLEDL